MMRLVYVPNRRLEDVSEAELLEQLGSLGSRKRGDYVRALDTWQSVFPREQLFIGFFEDIRGDRRSSERHLRLPRREPCGGLERLPVRADHAAGFEAGVAGAATTDARVLRDVPCASCTRISWPS